MFSNFGGGSKQQTPIHPLRTNSDVLFSVELSLTSLYVPRFSDTAPELFVDIALSARCDIFEDRDYVSLFSWLSPCLAGIWTVKCCILSK